MSRYHRRLLAVACIAVALDAGTKVAAVRWLQEPVDLGLARLRVTFNTGVAFSLGAALPRALVLLLTGAVVLVLLVIAWRGDLGGPVPTGLVLGGGLSNLLDRATGGSVVDLVDVDWFAVFNLADAFITTGVALLLLSAVRHPESGSRPAERAATDDPVPQER
jgi:signal peptidase II